MISKKTQNQYFIFALTGLCLLYLVIEYLYNSYAMLAVDEFWFAHRIYQYKDGLPYRDFAPYKTVLGYYLLLPALLVRDNLISSLILTKNYIAILNTGILFGTSLWLSRFFSRSGILASLTLLISSELVLSYSTQIRVDLFGYWLCFFSLLLMLEKRYITAGLLIGLGFAATQKAIWYIFASNCAWAVQWLLLKRDRKSIGDIIKFNTATLSTIAAYLIGWAVISSWSIVMASVFSEASAMYHLDWYDKARLLFWETIIVYNPLLFLLAPITVISLFISFENDRQYSIRLFVTTYACTILLCLIPYKQVFPYYMQVTIPVLLALYSGFFSWLLNIFTPQSKLNLLVPVYLIYTTLVLYLAFITLMIFLLDLPYPYMLISAIPIAIVAYTFKHETLHQQLSSLYFSIIVMTIIIMGIIYPFTLLPTKIYFLNGNYQKAQLNAMHDLLADNSDYVAGIELIYNKTQPINGIRHLMGPAIDYLRKPTPELKSVMLASLYEDPNASVDSVVKDIEKSRVKFVINNYRMMALASPLRKFIASQYEHFWGSIYLYAPQLPAGKHNFTPKFSGDYQIEANQNSSILVNGKQYANNTLIHLSAGEYHMRAEHSYRLKLVYPALTATLDPHFQKDDWERVIF